MAAISGSANTPVLGVFVTKAYVEPFRRGETNYEAEIYAKAALQRNVTLYYFAVDDIKGKDKHKMMWGWSFVGQRWTYGRVAWPHLVFDQVIDPEGPEKIAVSQLRHSSDFMWLSPRNGLPKWLTHRILARSKNLAILLPEERRLRSVADLTLMLKRHDSVLIKPNHGSRGRGITKIWREPGGAYSLQHSGEAEKTKGLKPRMAYELARSYAKEQHLVVSQQIPLLRRGNCLTDIRIIMGKDSQGSWLPMLNLMRVGKEGSFVTNWSMGAEEVPLKQGLLSARLAEAQVDLLIARLLMTSLTLAQALEAARGNLVEIGLDLAFDINLRLWFIEANACPGKDAKDSNNIPPHFASVIDGALHLWNTRQKRGAGGRAPRFGKSKRRLSQKHTSNRPLERII